MTEIIEVHENKYKTIPFCSTDDDTQSVKLTVTNKTSVGKEENYYQNTDIMRNHNTVILSLVRIRTSESQSDMKLALN